MKSLFITPLLILIPAILAAPSVPQSRIANGQDATRRQFPYSVSIKFARVHFGGGTIITPTWVATSCKLIDQGFTDYDVVAGMLNYRETHSDVQTRLTIKHVKHPAYDGLRNDIGLLKLESPFTITEAVKPIPLLCNLEDLQFGGETVTAGWGRSETASQPSTLQYIQMSLITQQNCRTLVNGQTEIDNNMLCGLPNELTLGSCTFDDGNPFVQNGVLIGLKTGKNLESCGIDVTWKVPNIFVSVEAYLPFIVDTTYTEFCGISPTYTTPPPSVPTESSVPSTPTPDSGLALQPTFIVSLFSLVSIILYSNHINC